MPEAMTDDPITLQVRALEGLGLEALRQEWRVRYGQPPKLRSPDLLARLLSWRIQADAWGGLDADLLKRLRQRSVPVAGPKLTPGVRLEREWRGLRHTVHVVEEGFIWNGTTYSSLTRIAALITGGKWNGPLFFGLRRENA